MNFRRIKRVILWHLTLNFLSLVQKIGRCARNPEDRGEAILFITKAALAQCEREWKPSQVKETSNGVAENMTSNVSQRSTAAADAVDEAECLQEMNAQPPVQARAGVRVKARSPQEVRDRQCLVQFVAGEGCRRKAWDSFFENDKKGMFARLLCFYVYTTITALVRSFPCPLYLRYTLLRSM